MPLISERLLHLEHFMFVRILRRSEAVELLTDSLLSTSFEDHSMQNSWNAEEIRTKHEINQMFFAFHTQEIKFAMSCYVRYVLVLR